MSAVLTVNSLVQEVREQADELNTQGAKKTDAIVRVLNRGLRIINGVLARHYPDTLIKKTPLNLSLGAEHIIPKDCWADMAQYIEISIPGSPAETRRRSYRDSTRLGGGGSSGVPFSWDIRGRTITFQQQPTGSYNANLFYVRKLEKLTLSQGQISSVGSDYVIVDERGADLVAASDSLNSYVNVIDFQTGEVKITLQIAAITDGKLRFRMTPARSRVLGRDVSGVEDMEDAEVSPDDFVCLVEGTCVPYFQDSIATYLVDYAVAALARTLGGDARLEKQILDDEEARTAAAWAGRETVDRVKNRSQSWAPLQRRVPATSG